MNTHSLAPTLTRQEKNGIGFYTDEVLFESLGMRIAFSERWGGVSTNPYATLNLGLHVEDDPRSVWQNRHLLAQALGVSQTAENRIFSAHQVHGVHAEIVDKSRAQISGTNPDPIEDTDALITRDSDLSLLLCFADCVPVILVNPRENNKVISVVHSGWRGTLADISGLTLDRMVRDFGVNSSDVFAYIGAYIGPQDFAVSLDVASQFAAKFDTLSTVIAPERADAFSHDDDAHITVTLDLADAIVESLTKRGVLSCNIVSLGVSTVQATDRFFSYRAEGGVTGRHGAFACLC